MTGHNVGIEMPKYKCHTEVHALKIERIEPPPLPTNATKLHIADEGFEPIQVPKSWVRKYKPKSGGYLVVYANGSKSFLSMEVFEEGYTRI